MMIHATTNFLRATAGNKNMLIPWYLMCSYAYYVEDDPILNDLMFDQMAKDILEHWDEIEHFHKHLISKDDLEAGSYLGEYPERIKGGLKNLRKSL